ncbi:MAG: cyclohexanone monooxygenase [Nocardioidaceae bacterium]|nr:cyclohexanone monooxygenase [Nocardioidaceae bacterium]
MAPHNPALSESNDIDYDVVVVGAGMGGIYATHTYTEDGLSVLGLEGAAGVGGVWYHNRYPGARVDVESFYYSYFFDKDLYKEWKWTERYPAQPEILAYLDHVAERFHVKEKFQFNTWMSGAQWDPAGNRYTVTTDKGDTYTCRYLVMTSGQLSKPRKPSFEGLDDFQGEWVQTSQWPDRHIELEGKRIAIIGTGSSGVQAIPILAEAASHLTVFHRTANYSIPANNSPLDQAKYDDFAGRLDEVWEEVVHHPGAAPIPMPSRAAADYTPEEQQARLEECWSYGGHSMNLVFTDQGTNKDVNDIVSEFVRNKIRTIVDDPDVAETLVPTEYPIGSRRLCVVTGFYKTFIRDNVTLVDVKSDPIIKITPTGIQTQNGHIEVDLIVFALGFNAFTGALDEANITNEEGKHPSDLWKRGPRTYLGLMTTGFPNLFIITGPGSPSVLANMIVCNVQHVDFVGDIISHMHEHHYNRVEPTLDAQDSWTEHVAEVASKLLRLNVENYMVHVNKDDNSRVFQPYAGGFPAYVQRCEEVIANDFEGFDFK